MSTKANITGGKFKLTLYNNNNFQQKLINTNEFLKGSLYFLVQKQSHKHIQTVCAVSEWFCYHLTNKLLLANHTTTSCILGNPNKKQTTAGQLKSLKPSELHNADYICLRLLCPHEGDFSACEYEIMFTSSTKYFRPP